MSHPHQERITHFDALVEHLSAFEEERREELAELYEVDSTSAEEIARRWVVDPDRFVAVLEEEFEHPDAWEVIDHLVQEHDLPLGVEWVDPQIRQNLTRVGVMKPVAMHTVEPDLDWIPGAIAAILAPQLSGTRPTIPVLLGQKDREEVEALAERYGISTEGARVEVVLRISETFAQPEFLDQILDRLPHPDWIGGAIMTFELGGFCYWREVFGHELDDEQGDEKVVPLMRAEERDEQKRIASVLLDLGVIFRVDDPRSDLPMVAVPEELWHGLWHLGHEWLIDWTTLSYTDLNDVAARKPREERRWTARTLGKLLACEAKAGHLKLEAGEIHPTSLLRLEEVTRGLDVDWDSVLSLVFDLQILVPEERQLRVHERASEFVDLSHAAFVREVLSKWTVGFIGTDADRNLARAVGLDEQWRQHLLDLMEADEETAPVWMYFEGIENVETGAGCLREILPGDRDLMMLELRLTNTVMCISKVHWLDMLSLLEPDCWYPTARLRELLQLVTSYGLFSQLAHIVEDPHSNYYFPVQRPSLMNLPAHIDAFGEWMHDVIAEMLEPMGVARLSDDGQSVWLDNRFLRVPTPPDWPDQPRLDLVRAVLDDPHVDFSLPESEGASLHSVPDGDKSDEVSIELPLHELLSACRGREIVSFDGQVLTLD